MKKKMSKLLILAITAAFLPLHVSAETACNHQWSDWEEAYEAECGDAGEETRYCTECYEAESREIPPTNDHEWDDWYVVKKATIHKTGLKERECWNCFATQTKPIEKLKPFVKISKKTVKLKTSKSYKIKLRYAKGDYVKKWKSSNRSVASVSKSGKVTAKKTGTAKITVTMKSGKKATCKIKVSAPPKKKASRSASHGGGTVYWTPGGSVYHSTSDCPTLSRSRTIYSGSRSNCPKPRGCKVCY